MLVRLPNKYDKFHTLTCRTEIIGGFFYFLGKYYDLAVINFFGQIISSLFWSDPQYDWRYCLDLSYHSLSVPYTLWRTYNTYGSYEYFWYTLFGFLACLYSYKDNSHWFHGIFVHCFGNIFIPISFVLMPYCKICSFYIAFSGYLIVIYSSIKLAEKDFIIRQIKS